MQQQQESGVREHANAVLGWLTAWSSPWRRFFTVGGTAGHREVAGVPGAVGLGVLALFALADPSGVLAVALLVAIASQLEHRLKSRRGTVHSYAIGRSHLERFGLGRGAEAALALLLGAALMETSRPAGWWFLLTGLGHLATVAFVRGRTQAVADDLFDAGVQAQMSDRWHPPPVRKPWEG